jgi:outer membrane lipoprotein
MRYSLVTTFFAAALLTGGCMNDFVIPEPLDKQVDRTVSFADLKRDPDAHKGKIVALGGVVLRARHLKDGTEIEVLQLPLSRYDQPDSPLEASQGRFMVLDPEHHDPAVLKDRRITLTGEVIGKKVATIDEFEYPFPYLSARFIHVWAERRGYAYGPPYYYPPNYYYPGPYPYWYPPYGYYRPPVWFPPTTPPPHRRFDSPSDNQPPPASNEPAQRRFEAPSEK